MTANSVSGSLDTPQTSQEKHTLKLVINRLTLSLSVGEIQMTAYSVSGSLDTPQTSQEKHTLKLESRGESSQVAQGVNSPGQSSCTVHIRVKVPVTDPKAQRGGTAIALLFLDLGARRGGWSAPCPGRFTPGKDPVPIVQEAGLDVCEKSRPHWDAIPGPSSP
jgi:hypothetical protein